MKQATSSPDFKRIHDEMIVIDGCAPLLSWGLDLSGQVLDDSGRGFDPYVQGGVTTAAASVSSARMSLDAVRNAVALHDKILEKRGFGKIRSAEDVKRAKREKKFGVWYHMQSSNCLEENLDALEELKEAGVGQLQPTYNYRNRFANGQLERVDGGLSKAGIDLVKKCNELQIIVDGSHQGARDVLDMIEFSSSPVIVSHANAKAVYDHPRNVSDEVIKAIAGNGGFVGVNGWPPFVSDSQLPTFDQFFAHLDHVVQLVGPEHTTIGMDYFQLIRGLVPDEEVQTMYDSLIASGAWTVVEYGKPPYVYPTGIETPATLFNLTGGLLDRGYSVDDVQKIMGGNWLRIMAEVWGA
jgi:membrane dipeptidase